MNRYEAGVRQHDTHRELGRDGELGGSPRPGALGLDAIIVPGARPAAYLDHAVTLARAAKCSLVILCSGYLDGREVKEYLDARSFRQAIVIELPPEYSHPLFDFRGLLDIKDQLPPACGNHVTDLSMKRNVGLVLAKMLGWRRIFFLDDNIRDIAYPDLQRTVDMLGSFSAAGMWVTEFPDNSIACHANRVTGGSQDVFVSGAALAVGCESDIGFFPDIYNGDWLFFFDAASKGELGNSYLKATQLAYNPFANAERAAWQEFGDVLAEGLYALLHLGRDVAQATSEYWGAFLDARRHFLEATLSRVDEAPPDMQDEITASLESALKCLNEITPDLCARYVEVWRQDLKRWKRRWAGVRVMASVDAALAELGLVTTPASKPKPVLDNRRAPSVKVAFEQREPAEPRRTQKRENAERIVQQDEGQLFFHAYIPSERLYAAETSRVVDLFRQWLTTVCGQGVRRGGYRTPSGEVIDLFFDGSSARPDLQEHLKDFSHFAALCAADPSAAAAMLVPMGLEGSASDDFVAQFGKQVRGLKVALAHERERRILDIRHILEADLVNAGIELGAIPSAQINALIESQVPWPSASSPLALIAAPQASQAVPQLTMNFNQQFITAAGSTIVQNVQGEVYLGPQAKEILALIDRFGGDDTVALRSDVHEFEDPDAPPDKRSAAKRRLKKFLGQLTVTARDVGVDLLTKYLESKTGLR